MANWASTAYAVEGPKETLLKIEDAILHPILQEDDGEGWEGGVLKALGIEWESKKPDGTGLYMRGFINESPELCEDGTLRFGAEEAWGATDFNVALEGAFPDIKVYYCVEEPNEEIYATNDKEGKYFPYRFYVDTCMDGNYAMDEFKYKSDVFKWLYDLTNGRINTEKKVEKFNDDADEECSDDFIHIYEYEIVD